MLEYDTRFIQAVEEGRASAEENALLEHDEVVERVEQMFRSRLNLGVKSIPSC
jgi:hypothetical protein